MIFMAAFGISLGPQSTEPEKDTLDHKSSPAMWLERRREAYRLYVDIQTKQKKHAR